MRALQGIRGLLASSRDAVPIWFGLAVGGLASYGFLIVAARVLDDREYAGFGVLWALTFLIGPGVFVPLEQEMARRVASRRAVNAPLGAVIRVGGLVAAALALVAAAVVASSLVVFDGVERLFGGVSPFALGLVAVIVSYAVWFFTRGVLAGQERFVRYGVCVAGEGGFRLAALAGSMAFVDTSPALLAGAFAAGPLLAALVSVAGSRRPPAPAQAPAHHDSWLGLGALVAGSVAMAATYNLGPPIYELVAKPGSGPSVGAVFSTLVVAGVPLFVFQALVSVFLPQMASDLARGDERSARQRVRRLLGAAALIGGLGVVGVGLLGPFVVRVLFTSEISNLDAALLTCSTLAFMLGLSSSSTLAMLGRRQMVAVGWWVGLVAALGSLALPLAPVRRVELALVLGPTVAFSLMWRTASAHLHVDGPRRSDATPASGRNGGGKVESGPVVGAAHDAHEAG